MENTNENCGAKENRARLAFRIIWFLTALSATVCTFTDHLSALGGDGRPVPLFFTTWSVWISTAAAAASLVFELRKKGKAGQNQKTAEQGAPHSLLNFCAAVIMTATFIVASFVLPDKIWKASYWEFGYAVKHFYLPLLTIADEILFPGSCKKTFPLYAAVFPLGYWAVIISRNLSARASFGGSIPKELWDNYYPYGFTNFDNGHSVKGLCLLLLGMGAGLVLAGYVFLLLKKTKAGKKSAA